MQPKGRRRGILSSVRIVRSVWRLRLARRLIVGFLAGFCRVPCRVFGPTRHGAALRNQWLIPKMSGLAGSHKWRESQRFHKQSVRVSTGWIFAAGAVRIGGARARSRRPFWTPVGLQTEVLGRSELCKSLRNLVGPPRFELGTSCTPSKRASQAAPRPDIRVYTILLL